MLRRILYIILFLCGMVPVYGSATLGGNGLIYVRSAKVMPKGFLDLYWGFRYFGKVASFTGGNAYTLWDVQSILSLNLGVSPNLELSLTPIIYQDINREGGNFWQGSANAPDDIFLSVKAGSFGPLESAFVFGGMLTARIPTARVHNIVYEPYSAGTLEVGVTGLVSYYNNPVFPEVGWSLHGNLGYLNHNDVGQDLTDLPTAPKPQSMSSELLIGFGIFYPMGGFDFSGEINARYFLSQPPVTAYSREYVSYLTAGIYYHPYPWVSFEMGFDLKLITEDDISSYKGTGLDEPPRDFPNYPSWRGIMGARFAILPVARHSSEKALLDQKAKDRREALEELMSGQKKTEDAESELAKIRAERQRIEDEMRRLRKLLEEEKKKKEEN